MIKQVSHQVAGIGPADLTLALSVAHALHALTSVPRAPEVPPVPQLMGLRTSAGRPHRRKVPLHRLAGFRELSTLGA
ncbi:hypothetical protein [Streptomyces diastatochromogenes]|uniref:hypothetical protein n=1 Tax=Streptomyces diastatochromogenes TaxID=42236 RepID=UPI0036783902